MPTGDITIQFPDDDLIPEAVADDAATYRRLHDERRAAYQRMQQLRGQIRAAEHTGDVELSEALLEGRQPTPPDVSKLEDELEQTSARLAAYERAITEARRRVVDVVAGVRDRWLDQITDRERQACADLNDQLKTIGDQVRHIDLLRRTALWLQRWPHKPVLTFRQHQPPHDAFAALSGYLDPQPPPPEPETVDDPDDDDPRPAPSPAQAPTA